MAVENNNQAPNLNPNDPGYLSQLKAQVWQALNEKKTAPAFTELLNSKEPTHNDVVYLINNLYAPLTVWDAVNLVPPTQKILLELKDASPHFHVYDMGSSFVATPKDLFSHERTPADSIQTAKAIAREAYDRGWVVQMAGIKSMTSAVWVELQHCEDQFGRKAEVVQYNPTFQDLRIYMAEAQEYAQKRLENR